MGFDAHAIYQPINNAFNIKTKPLYLDAHIAENLTDDEKIDDGFRSVVRRHPLEWVYFEKKLSASIVNMTSHDESEGGHYAPLCLFINARCVHVESRRGASGYLQFPFRSGQTLRGRPGKLHVSESWNAGWQCPKTEAKDSPLYLYYTKKCVCVRVCARPLNLVKNDFAKFKLNHITMLGSSVVWLSRRWGIQIFQK